VAKGASTSDQALREDPGGCLNRTFESADYFKQTHHYISGRPKLYRSNASVGASLRRSNAVVGIERCGGVQRRDGEELTDSHFED
jgi:hypothetical protein